MKSNISRFNIQPVLKGVIVIGNTDNVNPATLTIGDNDFKNKIILFILLIKVSLPIAGQPAGLSDGHLQQYPLMYFR